MNAFNKRFSKGTDIALFLIYIGIIFIFIMNLPSSQSVNYYYYVYLLFACFLTLSIYVIAILKMNVDVFEPYHMFMILSIIIYTIAPMVYIINDDTLCHGKYVMDGCMKGTSIYIVAIIFFSLGYFSKSRIQRKKNRDIKIINNEGINNEKFANICLIMWMICLLLYVTYMIAAGKSLTYILSFSMLGNGTSDDASGNSLLKFLLNFSYCLVPLCLYIIYYCKYKVIKFSVVLLTASAFYVNGSRFIIVILIYALFSMYYILRNKRPKAKVLASLLLVFFFVITFVGMTRSSVRGGQSFSFDFSTLWESFIEVLDTNFDIYQVYYAIVADVPNEMPFTLGQALFIDPLIMFIPRILWPSKPGGIMLKYISFSEGPGALAASMAAPYMPELYIEFGIIGVIFLMFFVGRLLAKTVTWYKDGNFTIDELILYCTTTSFLFQFIIRGYFASNFWIITFAVGSIKIIKIVKANLK